MCNLMEEQEEEFHIIVSFSNLSKGSRDFEKHGQISAVQIIKPWLYHITHITAGATYN